MTEFLRELIIYFICFVAVFYGLSALDFSKFIKQGKVYQTYVLYFVIAGALTYLFGQFIMGIMY